VTVQLGAFCEIALPSGWEVSETAGTVQRGESVRGREKK
jgi:hypothetical protein